MTKTGIILKLLNLVLLLGGVAWAMCSPGWESILTTAGLFIAFIGQEINDFTKSSNREVDLRLFEELLKALPTHGAIQFISKHDFRDSFSPRRLDELREFIRVWDDPEHEFLDSKLEARRKRLYNEIEKFMELIAENTFRDTPHLQGVPRDWEFVQPELFKQAIKSLHAQADAVVQAHEEMIREGRRKLRV